MRWDRLRSSGSYQLGLKQLWQEGPARGQNQEDVGMDDSEHYRQLNNSRKTRAEKFLRRPRTRFQLLTTLSIAHIIAPIVRLLFALHDSQSGVQDKSASAPRSNHDKRCRIRLLYKMNFAEQEAGVAYTFAEIKVAANKAVARLWLSLKNATASVFAAPIQFWPSSEAKSAMWEQLADEILRNIAALKWRVQYRFLQPPFDASFFCKYETVGDVPADLLDTALGKLTEAKPCCLDPFWALPVQQQVLAVENEEDKKKLFFTLVKDFFDDYRPSSLKEEQQHSVQRKAAGGHTSMPTSFEHQAAAGVISEMGKNFTTKGGRDLTKASSDTQAAAKKARVKKVIHKRPMQSGSPMFYYIAQQRSLGLGGGWSDLVQRWRSLDAVAKKHWKFVHSSLTRRKRASMASIAENKRNDGPPSVQTPWNVVDETWPLKSDDLDQYLAPFRSKRTGMDALQSFAGPAQFDAEMNCQKYRQQVIDGKVRYHSMSAASLASKAVIAGKISDETLRSVPSAQEILETPSHQQHCLAKHPGMCRTEHAGQIKKINKLVATFPRDSCIIRCESGRGRSQKVAYAAVTVGQARVNDRGQYCILRIVRVLVFVYLRFKSNTSRQSIHLSCLSFYLSIK